MLGTNTSQVEIENISTYGFWIFLENKEYYLSFEQYPWFKNATISDIISVQFFPPRHLYWENLDVDLDLNDIINPSNSPLIYK
ncbi:DUF2442 domain-containing protein [Candidatus Dependentiae bacterium]|nr:DUF2442 domain-containing protein [Candidatus Dependentiae bacterium]